MLKDQNKNLCNVLSAYETIPSVILLEYSNVDPSKKFFSNSLPLHSEMMSYFRGGSVGTSNNCGGEGCVKWFFCMNI